MRTQLLLQVVMHVEVSAISTQKDILHDSFKAGVSSHVVHCSLESKRRRDIKYQLSRGSFKLCQYTVSNVSNRQHASSHKCHKCKSRLHICNDSAIFSHRPSRISEFDPKHALKVETSSYSCSVFSTVLLATDNKAVLARCCIAHLVCHRTTQ